MFVSYDQLVELAKKPLVEAEGANGGNANNVKQMLISAGVSSNITWNMPS